MKKIAIMFILAMALVLPSLAQEEAERLSLLEGSIVMVKGGDGRTMTMLRLANGELIGIELPAGAAERLQLKERERLSVRGVYIGAVAKAQIEARIFVRSMTRAGRDVDIENAVMLTERDRLQLRTWEAEELQLRTQDRTQDRIQGQTQTRDQSQDRDGAGGASGGKK